MAQYHTQEFAFELPDGLKDKTHHIFALTDEGPSAFNLVISRNPIADDQTLDSYAERLLTEIKRALPQFRLLGQSAMLLAGEPALKLEYRWLNQGKVMHQVQHAFFHEQGGTPRQVIQITATVVGEFEEKWRTQLQRLVTSLQWRSENGSLSAQLAANDAG
jgi:hypothetical protein